MAYAYATIANDGERVSGSLAPNETGPGGLHRGRRARASTTRTRRREKRVFPAEVGQVAKEMLSAVVTERHRQGGRRSATSSSAGKTGTTENYGDAWFVGCNDD